MIIIVAGSRTFNNRNMMFCILDRLTKDKGPVILIHGGSKGADKMAEEWAWERSKTRKRKIEKVIIFHADWQRYGKRAGPIRNEEMARSVSPGSLCVVFWDGVSPGTKDMIRRAKNHCLKVKIMRFKK